MSQTFKTYRGNNNYKDYRIERIFLRAIDSLEKNNKTLWMTNHQLKANNNTKNYQSISNEVTKGEKRKYRTCRTNRMSSANDRLKIKHIINYITCKVTIYIHISTKGKKM